MLSLGCGASAYSRENGSVAAPVTKHATKRRRGLIAPNEGEGLSNSDIHGLNVGWKRATGVSTPSAY